MTATSADRAGGQRGAPTGGGPGRGPRERARPGVGPRRHNQRVDKPAARRITITGNKKTKSYIILRELSFKTGDSISLPDLVKSFQSAHDRLINTHLFNDVVVFLKGVRGTITDIGIDVKERWYIFPLPYFRP